MCLCVCVCVCVCMDTYHILNVHYLQALCAYRRKHVHIRVCMHVGCINIVNLTIESILYGHNQDGTRVSTEAHKDRSRRTNKLKSIISIEYIRLGHLDYLDFSIFKDYSERANRV